MSDLALVTGASSGIGRAYARRLAEDGAEVIATGRRRDRLDALAAEHPGRIRPIVADLADQDGIDALVALASDEPLTVLVNNAGVAHYKPFVDLPPEEAMELLRVKIVTPTLLARAAAPGMVQRGGGAIVNVAGMIAFSGPAPIDRVPLRRAVYGSALAQGVALSQLLHAELSPAGVRVQSLCPGIVATEFHERQGLDVSAVPRMSAEDVVTASLAALESGEVVCAPGVERADLLEAVFAADLAAFGAQSTELASRYR